MISEQHLAFITKSMTKISTSYYNRQNDLYNFVKRNVQKSKYLLALQLCEYCEQSTFRESLGDRMPFSTAGANAITLPTLPNRPLDCFAIKCHSVSAPNDCHSLLFTQIGISGLAETSLPSCEGGFRRVGNTRIAAQPPLQEKIGSSVSQFLYLHRNYTVP